MLSKKIEKAINDQINLEMQSGYVYLGMASHFDSLGLEGFASWMKKQHEEEMFHTMKFYDFVYDCGGKVEFKELEGVKTEYKSALEVFKVALAHEKHVTSSINKLYELAKQEKDYRFESLLKWYIDEQVEEEKSCEDIIAKIEMIGEKSVQLLYLDKELAGRVSVDTSGSE